MDKFPENNVAGAGHQTRESREKSPEDSMAGPRYETRDGIDKCPGQTTTSAGYAVRDSISECDRIDMYTGSSSDRLPLSDPMDAALAEDKNRAYPPTSQVILIMVSLLVSMFLVALVSFPAVFNWCSRMVTPSRTE